MAPVGLPPKGGRRVGGAGPVGLSPADARKVGGGHAGPVGLHPRDEARVAAHEQKHGGLLHYVGSKLSLAAHDVKAIPGGLVDVGKTGAEDVVALAEGAPASDPRRRRAEALGRLILHGTISAVEHPLRDPFATLTTVLPAARGVAGAGFRASAAAEAARAGEGAAGVVRAAARTPKLRPRLIRVGETHAPLHASRNPAVRAAQMAYDRALQHGLDTNPEGRVAAHAAKRVGGSLAETARFRQRMQQAVADDLERAGRELKGRKVAQAALRLTSENSTPEEAAAFHRAQAAKGVSVKRNRAMAALYDRVAKEGVLTQDAHGNVAVDAARAPELAAVDAKLAAGQTRVDKILRDYGLMSEEGLAARRDLPGIIRRAGASEGIAQPAGLSGSDAALEKRLAAIERDYEALIEAAKPGKAGDYKAVTALQNGQLRRHGYAPVSAQLRGHAEKEVLETMRRNPEHPAVKAWQEKLAEADAIRSELESRAEARSGLFETPAAAVEAPAGRSIYGPQGRGYVPYKLTEPKASRTPVASAAGPVVGKARPFIDSKTFTGTGLEQGLVPDNTTGLFARHLRRGLRFVATDQFRQAALATGSKVRRSSRDVLVRIPEETAAAKLPLEVERALGRKHVNLDELQGHEQALGAFLDQLIPGRGDNFATDRAQPIGTEAPRGYRWVDRNVLGDNASFQPRSRGRIARTFDSVNSAVTAATVYFKVGHIGTRVLTNAATTIIQGSAAPRELAKSLGLWRRLDHLDRQRALAAAGQHGFDAMPHEGENLAGRIATRGAQWWAKHADAPFRFASIAFEARRAGYRTVPQFRRLLDELENPETLAPAERARVEQVAKEANRAGIAYDRLNPLERNFIARAVWFYPWIKGSTVFAGHTLMEHPFKAAALGAAGAHGREQQQAELGDLPTYEQGLFRLAGGAKPLVADFSTFSPFATPAEVVQAIATPRELAGFANPVVGAADQLVHGVNQYGAPSTSPYIDALLGLAAATPEQQLAQAYLQRNADQSRRMFEKTPLSVLARLLAGPGLPRRINLEAAHSAAARERTGR